jgi:hypothetical protein
MEVTYRGDIEEFDEKFIESVQRLFPNKLLKVTVREVPIVEEELVKTDDEFLAATN